jgi:hypothetical protein
MRNGQNQQPESDEVENESVSSMEEDVGQMIPEWIHPPEEIVRSKRHPAQRLIMTHVKGRKHPAKLLPAQPPVVRVFQKILVVVPIYELIL